MIKNRYIVLSVVLMITLLALVVAFLPKLEETSVKTKATYKENVFNQSKVSTVDITLDSADLQDILENPADEKMVKASVVFNGKEITDVGFRVKGNMTLRSVAQMEDSDRYSFKIDFDQYDDSKNLYGLKKLNLNNSYSDSTFAREYLSYQLMDKMGIATPGNSYMYVTINGQEWGLYLGVEAIEETFLEQNFEDGSGDLYKPDGVGSDLQWISEDIDDYTGINLKTNQKSSDQSAMIQFLDVINNGGDLEEVMDVDEMLRYFAANTALVNLDHYQGNMKHNYYLYEQNGVFSILPWDYNMSFGGFGAGGGGKKPDQNTDAANDETQDKKASNEKPDNVDMKKGSMMMEGDLMNESAINFSITTPVSGTTLEDRPLLNALLANDEYREKYYEYLEEIATTFFTESNMSNLTSHLTALLLTYVEKDPTKFSTTEQFLEGMSGENSLVEFSVQRAESILKQLSGELVVEANTNSNGPSDGFGGPNSGNENPENMQLSDEESLDSMQPPDGQPKDMQPPNGGNDNMEPPGGENRQRPANMPNGEIEGKQMRFFEGGNLQIEKQTRYSLQGILTTTVLILILLGATFFVLLFKRRRI